MANKQHPHDDEVTQAQVLSELDELDIKLERLRVRYEQYFLGIERTPPSVLRTDVVRRLRKLEGYKLRNTALKFRLRSLVQKFHSYSTYWNRTLREIENGTYRRHLQRVEKRRERRQRREAAYEEAVREHERCEEAVERGQKQVADIADEAESFLAQLGVPPSAPRPGRSIQVDFDDLDDDFDSAAGFGSRPDTGLNPSIDVFGGQGEGGGARRGAPVRPSAPASRDRQPKSPPPPPPPRRGAPPARASAPQPPRRDPVRKLYDEFVATRERLGMGERKVSYDKFQRSLDKQAERVRQSHRCQEVDFSVVVKDGKPFLKPTPRK